MRNSKWTLTLVAAAAAIGLQACDVEVHRAPKEDTAAVSAPAPAPAPAPSTESTAAADSSAAPAPATTTAAAPAAGPADAGTVQGGNDTATTAANGAPAAQPDTAAMGAAPGAAQGAAPGATQGTATQMPSDGTAAPTELARFLQDNPPGGRNAKADTSGESKAAAGSTGRESGKAAKAGKS